MSKLHNKSVDLPPFKVTTDYSPAIAKFLQDLLAHRYTGINKLELHKLGHLSVSSFIAFLKKKGWVINMERITITDDLGIVHKGVANYQIIGCTVLFEGTN